MRLRPRAAPMLAALLVLPAPGVAAAEPGLAWHAEQLDGTVVASRDADVPVNPASVVKVATSLWALEELGGGFRHETVFAGTGALDAATGTFAGDLVVRGGGDPDFHAENVFLVATELNRRGVRRFTGGLVVDGRFWIDWERGSEGRERDPALRAARMADRLARTLDAGRWSAATRRTWERFAERRGLDVTSPPGVALAGAARYQDPAPAGETLVVHRSKPLPVALRRFNCYSNNDIERVGELLGEPSDLADRLSARWGLPVGTVRLDTTSGLGVNRMSPRQVVHLLRGLLREADRLGLEVTSLLPVAGCDPGTLHDFFPRLSGGPAATSLVGKTGTLRRTDGGVSVLAGYLKTQQGELLFCVVAPRSGRRLAAARRDEEAWVLDQLARHGGPHPRTCPPPLPPPDAGAAVVGATPTP